VRLRDDVDRTGVQISGVALQEGSAGQGDVERQGRSAPAIEPEEAEIVASGMRWPLLAIERVGAVGGDVEILVRGEPGDRVTLMVGEELNSVTLKKSEGFRLHLGVPCMMSLPQPDPIGRDGQLRIHSRLPAEATLVGSCFGVQAVVQRRLLGRRLRLVTNVDLIVVADGGAPRRTVAGR
jgi:hypothetical protein